MTPVNDRSRAALQDRFIREAETLGCSVSCFTDRDQAIAHILEMIVPDKIIQSWHFEHIPLPGLADALAKMAIQVVPRATTARVGLTGADAALAGTGSLVLMTGRESHANQHCCRRFISPSLPLNSLCQISIRGSHRTVTVIFSASDLQATVS